nr:hypothetical protein [Bacillota bacterium]
MPGYMIPCRYCQQLVPPDANTCPACGKVNPVQARCPKCAHPIRKGWVACSSCGLSLEITCPFCGQDIRGLPLIAAFRAVFSERYGALAGEIVTMKATVAR